MKEKNLLESGEKRLSYREAIIKSVCHPGKFLSGVSRFFFCKTHQQAEIVRGRCRTETLRHDNFCVMGFTLIELLVVVLIIGILAAVALPQYQKAVRKARMSEVATTFSSISKGIDMYLLENGYPADSVYFSGTTANAQLDIDLSCSTKSSYHCLTKVGGWYFACDPTHCDILLNTFQHADGTFGNQWLDNIDISWRKTANAPWKMNTGSAFADSSLKPELCRWWMQLYGADRVLESGNPSTVCNAYL